MARPRQAGMSASPPSTGRALCRTSVRSKFIEQVFYLRLCALRLDKRVGRVPLKLTAGIREPNTSGRVAGLVGSDRLVGRDYRIFFCGGYELCLCSPKRCGDVWLVELRCSWINRGVSF